MITLYESKQLLRDVFGVIPSNSSSSSLVLPHNAINFRDVHVHGARECIEKVKKIGIKEEDAKQYFSCCELLCCLTEWMSDLKIKESFAMLRNFFDTSYTFKDVAERIISNVCEKVPQEIWGSYRRYLLVVIDTYWQLDTIQFLATTTVTPFLRNHRGLDDYKPEDIEHSLLVGLPRLEFSAESKKICELTVRFLQVRSSLRQGEKMHMGSHLIKEMALALKDALNEVHSVNSTSIPPGGTEELYQLEEEVEEILGHCNLLSAREILFQAAQIPIIEFGALGISRNLDNEKTVLGLLKSLAVQENVLNQDKRCSDIFKALNALFEILTSIDSVHHDTEVHEKGLSRKAKILSIQQLCSRFVESIDSADEESVRGLEVLMVHKEHTKRAYDDFSLFLTLTEFIERGQVRIENCQIIADESLSSSKCVSDINNIESVRPNTLKTKLLQEISCLHIKMRQAILFQAWADAKVYADIIIECDKYAMRTSEAEMVRAFYLYKVQLRAMENGILASRIPVLPGWSMSERGVEIALQISDSSLRSTINDFVSPGPLLLSTRLEEVLKVSKLLLQLIDAIRANKWSGSYEIVICNAFEYEELLEKIDKFDVSSPSSNEVRNLIPSVEEAIQVLEECTTSFAHQPTYINDYFKSIISSVKIEMLVHELENEFISILSYVHRKEKDDNHNATDNIMKSIDNLACGNSMNERNTSRLGELQIFILKYDRNLHGANILLRAWQSTKILIAIYETFINQDWATVYQIIKICRVMEAQQSNDEEMFAIYFTKG